jgi:hypothetical protein
MAWKATRPRSPPSGVSTVWTVPQYVLATGFVKSSPLTPSHAINKGQRYRYYVSAALITEAGTDRAQSRRMVARVIGTRPEWLPKGGAGLCPPDPSFD